MKHDPRQAYTHEQRLKDAEKFIAFAAENGLLELTQGWKVAETYGVSRDEVRAFKAKYRNELSFREEGGK